MLLLQSYGTHVIYAVRRYAAHDCTQKVDSSALCHVTGYPGWNFSWSSFSNNYLEVDKTAPFTFPQTFRLHEYVISQ